MILKINYKKIKLNLLCKTIIMKKLLNTKFQELIVK